MRRIDGDGRQHREDMQEEMILEPVVLGPRQVCGTHHLNLFERQLLAQLSPTRLLGGHKFEHAFADAGELFDAHHEEFVEIIRRDREKT